MPCPCVLGPAVAAQGAQTTIYLAASPEVDGITSKYFDKCKPISSSPASYDTATAKKLWEVSEELTQAKAPARTAV